MTPHQRIARSLAFPAGRSPGYSQATPSFRIVKPLPIAVLDQLVLRISCGTWMQAPANVAISRMLAIANKCGHSQGDDVKKFVPVLFSLVSVLLVPAPASATEWVWVKQCKGETWIREGGKWAPGGDKRYLASAWFPISPEYEKGDWLLLEAFKKESLRQFPSVDSQNFYLNGRCAKDQMDARYLGEKDNPGWRPNAELVAAVKAETQRIKDTASKYPPGFTGYVMAAIQQGDTLYVTELVPGYEGGTYGEMMQKSVQAAMSAKAGTLVMPPLWFNFESALNFERRREVALSVFAMPSDRTVLNIASGITEEQLVAAIGSKPPPLPKFVSAGLIVGDSEAAKRKEAAEKAERAAKASEQQRAAAAAKKPAAAQQPPQQAQTKAQAERTADAEDWEAKCRAARAAGKACVSRQ
jgi:hypothetical protein